MRVVSASLILLVLLLAGCVGGARPHATGSSVPPNVVKADAFANADPSKSGEIVGRTLDDEFQPLPDVTVKIVGTPAQTTTTADGVFYFTKVPARGYTVQFSKSGYATKNQSILVTAGQRIATQTLLPRVADTTPFMDDGFIFRGHISCSVRGNVTGTNTNPECGAYSADQDLERQRFVGVLPDVKWLLIEAEWKASVPGTNDKLTLAIRPFQGFSWRQIQGQSPIRFMITPDGFADIAKASEKDYPKLGGQLQLYMFPGEAVSQGGAGAGTAIEQDFTLYATAWYRMDPPADFTRVHPT